MADADKKRKYLLFKKDDGRPDHLKPCAFFASADGCKNGSKCRFSHGDSAPAAPAPVPVVVPVAAPVKHLPAASTVVFSESFEERGVKSDKKKRRTNEFAEQLPAAPVAAPVVPAVGIPHNFEQMMEQQKLLEQQLRNLTAMMNSPPPVAMPVAPAYVPAPAPVAAPAQTATPAATRSVKKEKKQTTTAPSSSLKPGNLFPASTPSTAAQTAPVYPTPVARTPAPTPARPSSDDDSSSDEEFLFQAVNHALDNGLKPQTPVVTKSVRPVAATTPLPTPVAAVSTPFATQSMEADFPFMDPGSATKALETSGTAHATQGPKRKRDLFASTTGRHNVAPVQTFNPSSVDFRSINWEPLVTRTQAHKRFSTDYQFPIDATWINSRSEQAVGNTNAPRVIAIDCEMCETTDPVTGVKDKNALVRFSIVNGQDPSQVLLDTLVQPSMPISDLRTRIHGVTEDQLASVKYTLRHAQAALYNLITDRTIIIGHSVHNDLKALHFNHSRCIDTAYLYNLDNEPESMPSLRLVSEQVLGFQLDDSHDSVKDACTSLYAAVYIAQHGNAASLQRKSTGAGHSGEPSLLLHRLPDFCHEEHIMRVFSMYTNVIPSKIAPVVRGDPSGSEPVGKTTVYFPTQQHADLAFDSITGPVRPDKQNKPQKRLYLKGGGYIYIRK